MSRFYMYDSYSGAYAPVAEFANARPNSAGQRIREGRRAERMAQEGVPLYNTSRRVAPGSELVPVPGGQLANIPKKTTKAKRTLMQNLVGTTTKGKLVRGAGALGAGGLLIGGGVMANNARKKRQAEAAKSPLRKRYESLRARLGR